MDEGSLLVKYSPGQHQKEKNDFVAKTSHYWLNFQKDKCQITQEKREVKLYLHCYQLPWKHP